MWGQGVSRYKRQCEKRIIPTRVGTSISFGGCHTLPLDHPHACGDKNYFSFFPFHHQGSSPRVWGQVRANTSPTRKPGIIPTRVGTSPLSLILVIFAEDHPHACGDKRWKKYDFGIIKGSSPRVWGQEDDSVCTFLDERIIPTRVGTSDEGDGDNSSDEDHPHACGDKFCLAYNLQVVAGSSPRVWGQGKNFPFPLHQVRIIPTRVGTRRIFTKFPQVL